MHDIEPYYGWENFYKAEDDPKSPFFNVKYNTSQYSSDIYGYYIHPLWDYIGSETLYLKLLYVDYKSNFAVIEFFGEWNDALHNDVMHLKRNVIDILVKSHIKHFLLIGENVLSFHPSDDLYYEEWFDDIEDGWIVAINFRHFVYDDWKKRGIASYIIYGDFINIEAWRTFHPHKLYLSIKEIVNKLLM